MKGAIHSSTFRLRVGTVCVIRRAVSAMEMSQGQVKSGPVSAPTSSPFLIIELAMSNGSPTRVSGPVYIMLNDVEQM